MKLLILGMNHRSAPVAVRERFAIMDPVPPYLEKARNQAELDEVVLLSTCNRVEVVAACRYTDVGRQSLERFFLRELGGGAQLAPGELYDHEGRDAVRHLFRVASSLDSLVVGEPQILGQVKASYRTAMECGASGPLLDRLFSSAFAVAKRVRTETRIAERSVSVARVAVDLAQQIFEDLRGKRALLLGAGKMITLALTALQGAGLSAVQVANRSRARALELAQRFGASAHRLDDISGLLAEADILLSCLATSRPLLDRPLVERALRGRHHPLFVIDLGVPRNIDPEVSTLKPVYLYHIDDLVRAAESNTKQRRRETARAETLIEEAVERFGQRLTAQRAVPTIRLLRERAERMRAGEVEKALRKLDLDGEGREVVEALSRSIVNKLLHAPIAGLRTAAEGTASAAVLDATRRLFALEEPGEEDASGAPTEGTGNGAKRGEPV